MSRFLEIKNLRKSLGGVEILKGIDMHVGEGEKVVVIGRSGGGKSVLLRHILGLMQPDSGEVIFKGTNLSVLGEEALNPYRREIGMLFQNGALFDSMSVEENLAFPLIEAGVRDSAEISKRVDEALEIVDLPGQHHKLPAELSGGMKKRVALARAAISRPRLMLYDEPTTGLDPIVADSINHLINRLGDQLNMASIVVTHDMESAYMIADRIYFLKEGSFYFEGTTDEIRACEDPQVAKFVQGKSDAKDAVL